MKKIVLGLALAAGVVGAAGSAMAQPVVVVRPHHDYRYYHHRPVVVVRPWHRGHWVRACHWRHGERFCRRIWMR